MGFCGTERAAKKRMVRREGKNLSPFFSWSRLRRSLRPTKTHRKKPTGKTPPKPPARRATNKLMGICTHVRSGDDLLVDFSCDACGQVKFS